MVHHPELAPYHHFRCHPFFWLGWEWKVPGRANTLSLYMNKRKNWLIYFTQNPELEVDFGLNSGQNPTVVDERIPPTGVKDTPSKVFADGTVCFRNASMISLLVASKDHKFLWIPRVIEYRPAEIQLSSL